MKHFIGIDNGLDGGIVVLSEDGSIKYAGVMPTIKLGKGRMVDATRINAMLNIYGPFSETTVYLEEASKHSAGVLSLCSTHDTFASIRTVLILLGARYEIIRPQKWQSRFWARPKMANGQKFDTKAAALNSARKLWPKETWLASPRCSKPHDGIIDAALIAEYGRRLNTIAGAEL